MSYTIDQEQKVIRITGSGSVTDADMLGCIKALRSDPLLEPDMRTLSDMRDIEVAFTSDGIRQLIIIMRKAPAGRAKVKAAIVVSSSLSYGMGRMLAQYSDDEIHPSFQIFRDMAEAVDWLGIRSDNGT